MSEHDQLQQLMQRVAALEAREKSLTAASSVYQTVITTILANMDKTTRDNIIATIDQAYDIAYVRAIHSRDTLQQQKIKQADDIAQRIFTFAQGDAASKE
ncbi:MAG: sigma-S stabilization anti-adapter protein IraP [Gibbsiella quercinecans]|uniref:sigma-S stabilization anti-adapter protein IraP n=1 Tax=Gibbsiella quercinecans TaxID=929813 RepID=UPI00337FE906